MDELHCKALGEGLITGRITRLPGLGLAASIPAQADVKEWSAAPDGPATLIRGVAVFDGTRSLGRHDVLIRGDRIVAITAPFGSGWSVSTDSIAGGKSSVALTPGGGAPGGQPSLVMSGAVTGDFVAPWAGIGFNPGAQQFQSANIAAARAIRFWVRGEGKSLAVMGFSPATGRLPAVAPFAVGPEWREVTVSFADLKGFNRTEAMLLLITANQQPGPFRIKVADVRLVRE